MKRWMGYFLLAALACCGTFTSCVDDNDVVCPDGNGGSGDVMDAELMLTINFDMGPSSKVGDPGSDHGENVANWDNIGIYLVYNETGKVLNFKFSKEEFKSPKIYNVYAGNVDVYVAAFAETEAPSCPTPESVYNMKSADVSQTGLSDKENYMQNLFSGVVTNITLSTTNRTDVNVICKRLVAKVDMQYDVQPGIVEGNFVNAEMSSISFFGAPQAYIFPAYEQEEPSDFPGVGEILTLESQISERNGRVYSYMFPGEAYLNFSVMYKGLGGSSETKEQNYKANFITPLTANTWYKTNFTVKGTNVSSNESTVEVNVDK